MNITNYECYSHNSNAVGNVHTFVLLIFMLYCQNVDYAKCSSGNY